MGYIHTCTCSIGKRYQKYSLCIYSLNYIYFFVLSLPDVALVKLVIACRTVSISFPTNSCASKYLGTQRSIQAISPILKSPSRGLGTHFK